ncbi:MAG: histidine phosphatase family protein [Hylemonella sp.]|uniref:histidine phosphatase family protein n=1 Tax=Hylemonella sp. TaxID=2066020 RepID=UPI0022C614F0|nr:histidine phosphatase family protein [Hylemonella sp.]MCZ8253982.1 histidine phosphatase family protein [Hylemonella sp.]
MQRRLLLGTPALLLGPRLSAATLGQRLSAGGHVLLMRHAEAPGVGDPPGFRLEDCSTQRNLSATGREQARAAGRWLRGQGVPRAQVWSSPWCRCLDTARLLDYGAVTVEPSLSSFFGDYERGPQQREALQAFVARLQGEPPGLLPVLVTHQVVISAYVGGGASSAEMVLVRVDRQGRPLDVSRYAPPAPG